MVQPCSSVPASVPRSVLVGLALNTSHRHTLARLVAADRHQASLFNMMLVILRWGLAGVRPIRLRWFCSASWLAR